MKRLMNRWERIIKSLMKILSSHHQKIVQKITILQKYRMKKQIVVQISGKIVIPEKVRINNKTYRVTVIRKSAFKNNKILHDIIIPSSVIIIESSAFENCRNLERVQIGKNVNAIGKNAFKNCKKLKTIVFKTSKLTKKKVGKNALKGVYKKTVIRVPKGMKKKYMFLKKKGLNEKQQKIM